METYCFDDIRRHGQLTELSGLDRRPECRKHDLKKRIVAEAAGYSDLIHDQFKRNILMRHRIQ